MVHTAGNFVPDSEIELLVDDVEDHGSPSKSEYVHYKRL